MNNETQAGNNKNPGKISDEKFLQRVEAFLAEIRLSFPYIFLYYHEYINKIVISENINQKYFKTLFDRMRDGKGLFSKPHLLGAILEATGYPASRLFQDGKKPLPAELVLSPGLGLAIENIVTKALLNPKKTQRQLGTKKSIEAATNVWFAAACFQNTKNYEAVFPILFASYSAKQRKLYQDNRMLVMKAIIPLAKHHFSITEPEQTGLLGSVLLLAYEIFEIERIGYSFISAAGKYSKAAPSRKPE